jgi:hypothetical protein
MVFFVPKRTMDYEIRLARTQDRRARSASDQGPTNVRELRFWSTVALNLLESNLNSLNMQEAEK